MNRLLACLYILLTVDKTVAYLSHDHCRGYLNN